MVSGKHSFHLSDADLQAIWDAAGLGIVHTAAPPAHGAINPCLIVNDAYVIRFDTGFKGVGRFRSEAVAYQRLAGSEVPVPEVIALDGSGRIVPYEYLITNKLPGTPVIDCWRALSEATRQDIARQAGRYLAVIHGHSFGDFFGKLWGSVTGEGFDGWYAFIEDYGARYTAQAINLRAVTPETVSRIQAALESHRPLLDRITQSALVHSDYHFENILQQDGVITGVIDFEWAYAGDPSSDFHIQERWEEMCPGSVTPFLEGYQRERPLDADHNTRRLIYALLLHLETVVDATNQGDEEWLSQTQADLLNVLRLLES
jgi:aminoglycoside phosphotransferase (APT) family kinase protein